MMSLPSFIKRWNTDFTFPHPGRGAGKLVMSIWDFDEKTLQGSALGKLMGSNEKDAFLGWCEVSLDGASLDGTVVTASMEKRSSKSHVSGAVTIKLKLVAGEASRTSSSTQAAKDHHESVNAVREYYELIQTFKLYEVGNTSAARWDADLSPAALAVLDHYVFRKGLLPIHTAVSEWCGWISENRNSEKICDFALRLKTLEEVLAFVEEGSTKEKGAVSGLLVQTVDGMVEDAIAFIGTLVNRPHLTKHQPNCNAACLLLKYVATL